MLSFWYALPYMAAKDPRACHSGERNRGLDEWRSIKSLREADPLIRCPNIILVSVIHTCIPKGRPGAVRLVCQYTYLSINKGHLALSHVTKSRWDESKIKILSVGPKYIVFHYSRVVRRSKTDCCCFVEPSVGHLHYCCTVVLLCCCSSFQIFWYLGISWYLSFCGGSYVENRTGHRSQLVFTKFIARTVSNPL